MTVRGGSPVHWYLTALLVASTSLPAVTHAATLTITPASVAANYTGTITLDITGLASGQTVRVETFLDINSSGTIDGSDMLVQSFQVTDGEALSIGGVRNTNVPGDEDAVADQKIRAVLNFQAFAEANKGVAKFIYRVSPATSGFTPVTAAFTITQSVYGQKVVGKVTSGGAAVPYAFTFLTDPSLNGGPTVAALADASGNFTLNAAPGSYAVLALKAGFVSDFSAPPVVTVNTGATVTQNLALTAANRTISGRLTDVDGGAGIPGVQMSAQSNSGLFALVFSDASGNFTIPVSSASSQWGVDASNKSAALLGYVGLGNRTGVDISGGSGVSIEWPKATALIYGTLKDHQTHQGIVGVEIWIDNNNSQYEGSGVTDLDGDYIVGVTDGTWWAGADSSTLASRGYLGQGAQVTVSLGQALHQDLEVQPFTAHLIGQVTDDAGQPVSNICISAYPNQGGNSIDTQTDANGNFSVGVVGGPWNLELCSDDAQQRGLLRPSLSFNVTDGVDIRDIQYRARRATAQITGWVKDNTNTPLADVRVWVSTTVDGIWYDGRQRTDSSGNYSVGVFNGTWQVSLDCGDLQSRGYLCPNGKSVAANGTAYFTVQLPGALQITTTSLPNATQGQSYGVQLNVTGGVPSYNWDLAPGSQQLPPGLNLSSGGYLSGTPTNGGTYNFTVRVTDAASHTATQDLSLFITTQPLQITTYGLPSGQVGVAYSTHLQASGGQPPYMWSLTPGSNALPPGLNPSEDGTISGTPTTFGNNFSFFIRVTDSANNFVDRNFSIFISPAPLQWVTTSLPDGRVGSAYSTQLQATGGVPPYYWMLATGSLPLPPGLILDPGGGATPTPGSTPGGTMYGTPTTEGAFNFIVHVSDSYGQSVDRPFSLLIQPRIVTPTPTATATVTPTPTPRPPGPCVGDCSGDGRVTVDEILTMVNIALGRLQASACLAGDANHNEQITIDEILAAVNDALAECPASHVCGGIAGLLCQSGEVCNLHDPTCAVLDLAGECVKRPEVCPEVFDPVCGCDGVTYANECLRLNAGATLAHAGACP